MMATLVDITNASGQTLSVPEKAARSFYLRNGWVLGTEPPEGTEAEPTPPTGDLEARVDALAAQLAEVQSAVAAAGDAIGDLQEEAVRLSDRIDAHAETDADAGDRGDGGRPLAERAEEELRALVTARGLAVRGTGKNGRVLKADLVAALTAAGVDG